MRRTAVVTMAISLISCGISKGSGPNRDSSVPSDTGVPSSSSDAGGYGESGGSLTYPDAQVGEVVASRDAGQADGPERDLSPVVPQVQDAVSIGAGEDGNTDRQPGDPLAHDGPTGPVLVDAAVDLRGVDSGGGPGLPDAAVPQRDVAADGLRIDVAPPPANSWTVFIYGLGDNSLSSSLFTDLVEMLSANLGTSVKLVVMADWDSRQIIPTTTQHFPEGYFVYLLEGSSPSLDIIDSGTELALDNPAVLTAGTYFAFSQYPAAHYGVVLWDHGGAWSGGFGQDTQNGTSQGSSMGPETVANALRTALASAGISGERPLDFFSFDACLMAGAETVAAFSSLSKTFIGNAEIDYGNGWDYAATFTWLGTHPGATPAEFASHEVVTWDAQHASAGVDDVSLRSHVALDLSKFPAFITASKGFADAVAAGHAADFSKAAFRSVPGYRQQVASPSPTTLRDLGQVARSSAGGGLATVGAELAAAIQNMRLGISRGDYRAGQDGLNVEAGPARQLSSSHLLQYATKASTWEAATGWGSALNTVISSADSTGPKLTGTLTIPASPGPSALPHVDFQVTDSDVMLAEVSLVQQHPSQSNILLLEGYLSAAFIGPGRYTFTWSGAQWSLSASPTNLLISLEPWVTAAAQDGSIEIPIFAVRGHMHFSWGEDLACTLLVDAATLQAPAVAVDQNSGSAVRLLSYFSAIDSGVLFVPEMTALDKTTGAASNFVNQYGVSIPSSGYLQIEGSPAPAGSYALLLAAYDYWANLGQTAFDLTLAAPIPQ